MKLFESGYERNKRRIEQKIREGTITVLEIIPDKKYSCYFCQETIDGKVRVLVDKGEMRVVGEDKVKTVEITYTYYSHICCYEKIRPKDFFKWTGKFSLN